jgi:DNA segregation ATPase FtsK/SpoIIIE-like protein
MGSKWDQPADRLYDRAVALILTHRKCSHAFIRRALGVPYNDAEALAKRMEQEAICGAAPTSQASLNPPHRGA